jgi:hypothetical protein
MYKPGKGAAMYMCDHFIQARKVSSHVYVWQPRSLSWLVYNDFNKYRHILRYNQFSFSQTQKGDIPWKA